jgi:hypothetical protein
VGGSPYVLAEGDFLCASLGADEKEERDAYREF